MKKPLLCFLMCAYSVILIKPVIPVLADFIAHTFWYSQHMATVHIVNGRYHIHYDLYQSAKGNSSENDKSYRENHQTSGEYFTSSFHWDYKTLNPPKNPQVGISISKLQPGIRTITYKPPRCA